jgi:hypothetical protein
MARASATLLELKWQAISEDPSGTDKPVPERCVYANTLTP